MIVSMGENMELRGDEAVTRLPRGAIKFSKAFPAYVTCMRKYAVFSGRASLAEYWWYFTFNLFFPIVVAFFLGVVMGVAGATKHETVGAVNAVNGIYILATITPSFAVVSRRLHDVGKSAWSYCWCFTIIGALYVWYLILQPSQAGPNKYGEPEEI